MSEEELKNISKELIDYALYDYNNEYGTALTINDITVPYQDLIAIFVLMAYFGYEYLKEKNLLNPSNEKYLERQFGKNYKDYKGINATTDKVISNQTKDLQDKELEKKIAEITKSRNKTIIGGLAVVFYLVQVGLATTEKRMIVGAITRDDGKVREKHRQHHLKYWVDNGKYTPWFDFRCRCKYRRFTTEEEAIKAGFTKLKRIPS